MPSRVVRAKIAMQGALLGFHGAPEATAFDLIARRVRSGDPDNLEAQAARRYWPALMGPDFRRDRDAAGTNALLNYGYAVIRATAARAVVAAGLHPTIGIFHANRGNAFALADDLVEPFRSLVDALVVAPIGQGVDTLDPAIKRRFVQSIAFDVRIGDEMSRVPRRRNALRNRWCAVSKQMHPIWRCLPHRPTPAGLLSRVRWTFTRTHERWRPSQRVSVDVDFS